MNRFTAPAFKALVVAADYRDGVAGAPPASWQQGLVGM
jgi:hypothetical protein